MLTSLIPLNEILIDFHDRIKSLTRGYGSMDYEQAGYVESEMVKLDMLVNTEPMDAFSCIIYRSKAEGRGRAWPRSSKKSSPGNNSPSRSRPPSAAKSSPPKSSAPSAKTSRPNATAVTCPANASCWRNRRKAKSG